MTSFSIAGCLKIKTIATTKTIIYLFIYLFIYFRIKKTKIKEQELGMAILPRPALTRPAPPHPARVFPAPQRWWGGDGAIFCPRTPGRGGDGFSIFIPALSPPRTNNKDYNCKFSKP